LIANLSPPKEPSEDGTPDSPVTGATAMTEEERIAELNKRNLANAETTESGRY